MKTVKHIIQKQVFEMRGYSKRPGFEWEQSVADHHRSVIMPGIEACFDALPVMDEHLVIDSIDIDLGVFTHESFAKEARERLVSLLGERLRECRKKALAPDEERLREEEKLREKDIAEGKAKKEENLIFPENVLSAESAVGEALLHFLRKGDLPWWFAEPEKLFQTAVLSDRMIVRVRQLLLKERSAMIRFIKHFPDEMILEFLERSGHFYSAAKQEWQMFSNVEDKYPAVFPRFRQRFWMERFYAEREMLGEEAIIRLFKPLKEEFISEIYKTCLENNAGKVFEAYALFLEPIITDEKTKLRQKSADEQKHSGEQKEPGRTEGHEEKIKPSSEKDQPENIVSQDRDTLEADLQKVYHQSEKEAAPGKSGGLSSSAMKDEGLIPPGATGNRVLDEAIYVEAAGLVLLHPFLTELFSSTGLWKNSSWTSAGAPFKAIQLMSFLTFGAQEVPEYRLAFHKILAGLDVATPLPAEEPLLPEERDTCVEMLEAVLKHWTALKNTGMEGLREGFLLRNGKLEQTPKGIKLDVERLAQDVLLARLPWGYSTVKLPWLEPLLMVSWI